MDEMLKEFLAEVGEQIEAASTQIVALEREPGDMALIAGIFRLVHTIKGTCGFLGLERLQRVTHAAESLIGALRDGAKAKPDMVSAPSSPRSIAIKAMLAELEETGTEGAGDDSDVIAALESLRGALQRRSVGSAFARPNSRPDIAPAPAPSLSGRENAVAPDDAPQASAPAPGAPTPQAESARKRSASGSTRSNGSCSWSPNWC